MSKKEPNYQSNVFHRYSVKQQHINMFIGYVFGCYDNENMTDIELNKLCENWINKFQLDIDVTTLRLSYQLGLQIFKECLKQERK
jgi:hypothetical protein